MTLTYEGNLGIGKTDPSARLEVTGLTSTTDVFVTNDVQVGGNISISGDLSIPGTGSSITVNTIYVGLGTAGILNSDGEEIVKTIANSINELNITGVSTLGNLFVEGKAVIDGDETSGGGLSINPVTYEGPTFAPLQIGYPLDFTHNEDFTGIGSTAILDNESVADITLLAGGQVGIGTTALDESTALLVYGDSVIERLAIGVGVTEMTTAALNVKGPILISEGNLATAGSGTPSADVNTVGIVTAGKGFMSGAGTTGVHIDVTGNIITFSVPGVGTTTLTLF